MEEALRAALSCSWPLPGLQSLNRFFSLAGQLAVHRLSVHRSCVHGLRVPAEMNPQSTSHNLSCWGPGEYSVSPTSTLKGKIAWVVEKTSLQLY